LASIIAGWGSKLVAFLQAGIGAIARTVQDKLRERVSVMDFGAVGDYTTDDTAAIQLAVNSFGAAGGTVWFPAGNYRITAVITLPANVSLLGEGAYSTLISPTTAGITVFKRINAVLGVANISIRGIGIDCAANANITGIAFTLCSDTDVQDVVFSGCRRNVDYDRGHTHNIINCVSRGTAGNKAGAMRLWSSVDTDYIFHVNVDGYNIRNVGNGVQPQLCYVRRGVGVMLGGVQCNDGGATGGSREALVVFENDCQGCKVFNGISSATLSGVVFQTGTGVAVAPSLCTVQNFDIDGSSLPISVVNGTWIMVSGCNITASGTPSTAGAIYLQAGNHIMVDANLFHGYTAANDCAIALAAGISAVTITNNTIDQAYAGIWFVVSSLSGIRVLNNTCTNTNNLLLGTPLTGAGNLIAGNRGLIYSGDKAPAMPATTVAATNLQGMPMRVFIAGGTVTAVSVNGVATGLTSPASFVLNPDETVAITYSVAPTWKWLAIT
jgi:hypothetical protein